MTLPLPSVARLRELAEQVGFDLDDAELATVRELMTPTVESLRALEAMPEPRLAVTRPRTPGRRPRPDENPFNAWYWRCDIEGAPEGPLHGKTVAVKDNVCVAGVPMMNGSSLLEGFVPDEDATVVTRILDAGATIAGKSTCEHLCVSDASHLADSGPVPNPFDPSRSAGGSSSGSAVLTAIGACDAAIGTDQGGSIRMPAAFCGIYGLKPTYGLVPYTGIFPLERTFDHVGPMAARVRDAALLLQAVAGRDGVDSRQPADLAVDDYVGGLEDGVAGLRVGVLQEGFEWPNTRDEVVAAVRHGASALAEAGAVVADVSLPAHRDSLHVWNGIAVEGVYSHVILGHVGRTGAKGHHPTALVDAFRRGLAANPDALGVTAKVNALLGAHVAANHAGHYYTRAQNHARELRAAYDGLLDDHDVLLLPTTAFPAPPMPAPDASLEERYTRALEVHETTCAFDVTGHPAISIPCGTVDGLPVGMTAVAAHGADALLLRLARACEQALPPPRPPGWR